MEREIRIDGDRLKLNIWHNEGWEPNVFFEYTEGSPDPYYSDIVTSVDIDKEKAIEIIDALKEIYKI